MSQLEVAEKGVSAYVPPLQGTEGQPPPIAESLDWKKQNHVFQDIALTSFNEEGVLSGTGQPERIVVQDVTDVPAENDVAEC